MKKQLQLKRTIAMLVVAGFGATLAACGGGGGGAPGSVAAAPSTPAPVTPPAPPVVTGTVFQDTALVMDVVVAAAPTPTPLPPGYQQVTPTSGTHADANLINPWGLAFNPKGFSWIANEGSATSTLYDGNGVPQSLVVSINPGALGPAKPTGIVFNGTQDFKVTANGLTGAGAFIFASLTGTITAWSSTVDGTHALVAVDNGPTTGAVYKGLAISSVSGTNYIYATDVKNNRIDVFDGSFKPVTLPGGFKDPNLPANYVPFGIQAINGNIFVAYGAQNGVPGAGLGMVSEFDSNGNLIKELIMPGGVLNNPWGIAMAPANFGKFSNDLLIGNFGDGTINAFDPATGKLVGTLSDATGKPLTYPGLWAIAFGNGIDSQPVNTLFYTAGSGGGLHGTYGRIDVAN